MDSHALVLLHRSLRLEDNTALLAALEAHERVSVGFLFDPRQLEPHPYRSLNGLQYLLQALEALEVAVAAQGGTLHLWQGPLEEVFSTVISTHGITPVYIHRDYTPFARCREKALQHMASTKNVQLYSYADVLLTEPEQVNTHTGTPYKVFSAFHRAAAVHPVRPPRPFPHGRRLEALPPDPHRTTIAAVRRAFLPTLNPHITAMGARKEALSQLQHLPENYAQRRDTPADTTGTSHLSAAHKYGTISIRESYQSLREQLGVESPLLRQLYWRDFFTHVAWHWPEVFTHQSWQGAYEGVIWDQNPVALERWKAGMTGFPIIDAGMRQLRATGWMHNRVRMLTASFLTKQLHLHWREGERHFATHLVDYDPCVNNGSWQWAASTGTDAQPYFRVFNPWLQQRRYDPEARYIYHWVPELRAFTPQQVHTWYAQAPLHELYPPPMCDHRQEANIAIGRFRAARGASS
ncbi:deoxyribodipyrimidine photo-lyase [Candidatus Peribacteria bacterium]|nr:deoxyribodipyrimidine photo-lyase [Candidatus Peribacteria bacterium]